MYRPKIIIPLGDPAGIGPEIIAKALESPETSRIADCIVVGDAKIMKKAINLVGADLQINMIDESALQADSVSAAALRANSVNEPALCTNCSDESEEEEHRSGVLNLIDLDNIDMTAFEYGKVSAMCGQAAFEYIKKSIELTLAGKADAVATTPINKESLHAANVPYIGHTEIFGALTGTPDPLTMFETNGLRVFFLTRHLSLRDMLGQITKANIIACVKECTDALRRLGVTDGTMAIAGLNPHCGEHGLFGWEEVNEIAPAVEELQRQGYRVAGPIGADSVFHQAAIGRYNSVLSLYHDQGHIATKTLDFERTISITNGMPILRTSVDHGTAFDIAGTGLASGVSMAEAIRLAAKYAPCFSR